MFVDTVFVVVQIESLLFVVLCVSVLKKQQLKKRISLTTHLKKLTTGNNVYIFLLSQLMIAPLVSGLAGLSASLL